MDLVKEKPSKRGLLRRILVIVLFSALLAVIAFIAAFTCLLAADKLLIGTSDLSDNCSPLANTTCQFVNQTVISLRDSRQLEILPLDDTVRRIPESIVASTALTQSILTHNVEIQVPKVAYLFLTRGPLPLELVWARFFKGHKGKYSIYIHSSDRAYRYTKANMATDIFIDRHIPSYQVTWGYLNVVAAERRLLQWALLDLANQFFVLVSEACIPIRSFNYVYNFLLQSEHSFVDGYEDKGPHGIGRYMDGLAPEVTKDKWRKGSQWFALHRRHALAFLADSVFYSKLLQFCRGACYADEHYLQTFLHIVDPMGVSNYSVTFCDWSARAWHPTTFSPTDINSRLFLNVKRAVVVMRYPYDQPAQRDSCLWNGQRKACFLFARKFNATSVSALLKLPRAVLGY